MNTSWKAKPKSSFSILRMIEAYDAEREAYIAQLEADLEKTRKDLADMSSLMLERDAAAERFKLTAIIAGAFDKPSKKARPHPR